MTKFIYKLISHLFLLKLRAEIPVRSGGESFADISDICNVCICVYASFIKSKEFWKSARERWCGGVPFWVVWRQCSINTHTRAHTQDQPFIHYSYCRWCSRVFDESIDGVDDVTNVLNAEYVTCFLFNRVYKYKYKECMETNSILLNHSICLQ